MAERLVIRLFADRPAEWLVLDERDNRIGAIQSDELANIAPHAGGRRVIGLIPGADVAFLAVRLPIRNARKLEQALPYALEEHVAEDINELLFAAGPQRPDGKRAVTVVRRAVMDNWLTDFSEAGLRPDILMPDTLLPPITDDGWHIALEHDQAVARTGTLDGFVADHAIAATVLGLTLDQRPEASRPDNLTLYTDDADNSATALREVASAAGVEDIAVESLPDGTAMSLAGTGLPAAGNFNLLQGAYRPRRNREKHWRRWRVAAILAGVWLVLAAAWQGAGYWQLKQREDQLHRTVASVFKRALPGRHRMVNPRAQLTTRLRELRSARGNNVDNGLLELMQTLGDNIGGDTRITTLNWHNGRLNLRVSAPSVKTLGDLRTRLAKKTSLDVQIESANAREHGVDGQLQIGGKT